MKSIDEQIEDLLNYTPREVDKAVILKNNSQKTNYQINISRVESEPYLFRVETTIPINDIKENRFEDVINYYELEPSYGYNDSFLKNKDGLQINYNVQKDRTKDSFSYIIETSQDNIRTSENILENITSYLSKQ